MKSLTFICVFLWSLTVVRGQSNVEFETGETKSNVDSNYILSFQDDLMVRLIVDHKSNSISINAKDTTNLFYKTNNSWTQGIGIAYKWLALDVSVKTPLVNADPTKGTTTNTSIGLGINGGRFWTRVFYETNSGYYLENIKRWDKDYFETHTDFPYRGDITSKAFYASVNYGFNARKYSNKANMTQQDRQIKGAGSFTAGLTYWHSVISANYSLVPKKYQPLFPEAAALEKEYAVIAGGINVGYLRNVPLSRNKKWSVSFIFIPGLSVQSVSVVTELNENTPSNIVLGGQLESRISLGYNGDKWYYGAIFRMYNLTNAYIEASPISQGYVYSRLYLGYKFPMKETKSKLLKKLKF